MKAILRGYGLRMSTEERQKQRAQAADMTRTRGTSRRPNPPRNVVCQSASRGVLVTWNYPLVNSDIQRWRVYKNDENTLFAEIADRGTRQCFVEASAGANPPTINIMVSSLNAAGVESPRAYAQGQATAEAGAPAVPGVPPEYNAINSGGADRNSNYTGGPNRLKQ